MDDVVELQNMENVCRLCLSNDEPKTSVFGAQDSPVSLATKIQACLSIQISATDKLTTQICAQCVKSVNQWHIYKELCLRSQDKLHQWLEKHLQPNPMVVTIKDEPVDLDFYEDNIEVISESTSDSDVESTNFQESINNSVNTIHIQEITDDEADVPKAQPAQTKDTDVCIKLEPQEDYDTDCTIEIESVTGSELVPNPLSNKEDRIMEADSTQKPSASTSASKKKIHLHSKYSYTKHMERFHTEKPNGGNDTLALQDEEELVEDLEDELMSMEKDAPLTQVQQNIISQLKTFSCYSCQQSFSDRRSTLSHIRQHMPDLRPYTCIACLTEFPDRSMYKLHCGASFECAMKIALVIPNQGEEKYFTCNMCLRSLQNRKELLSHLSKHSDKQYQQLVSPARSPPKLKPISPLPAFKQESMRKSGARELNIPRPYKNGDPAHNHVCDLCGMIYRYRPNMLKHRDLCQRLLPEVRTSYKCVHCGMTYLVFKKFHTHVTLEHKKKDFTCSDCNAKFRSPSDYLAHHETHRVAVNRKPVLEKQEPAKGAQNISTPIKDWDTFEAEVNAGRLSDSNQYSCALCNLEFATRAELTEHRNLHLKVKIYSCVICRSMFSSAGALEIHMKDHGIEDPNERNANSSCVEYGTMDDSSHDSKPMNISATSDPGTNKNECIQCGKLFSNYANLRRHTRNVHKPTRIHVSCAHCSRSFKSKEIRDRHIMTEHNKPSKPVRQCPQCPKTFVFQANLNLHFQTAHVNKKAGGYECDICGKMFIEEASLKIHRGWHNRSSYRLRPTEDQKPIKDSIVCNDKFNDVTELRKHLWDVHCAHKSEKNLIGEEFQCEICTTVFPDKATLDMHMQWHKSCPILTRVRKPRHQGNFPCDVCGKLYSSKKVLWRHKKLHKATNVAAAKFQSIMKKPTVAQHICNVCHKVFCSNQSLQRHQMNLHSEMFNQRQHLIYPSSTRRTSQEESATKKLKLEKEDVPQKPTIAVNTTTTGKKPVMCHVCRKFFPNMSVLYKHKQLMHSKSRMMKNAAKAATTSTTECVPLVGNDGKVCCNVCFKSFSAISHLRQHFTIKHKNSPPKYACPVDGCKLMFPSHAALKAHELTHTSMIFSCNLCGRHVFNRQAMTDHMLSTHNTVYDAEHSKNFHRETDLALYVVQGAVDATCPHCKIKYPNNRAMKIHYFKFHDCLNQA
ncbi:Zinc finger protein 91 [Dufourea novaeangliae]|uniref:Zinc finger protein 91 n=1 Tax=Dufourea novaeangliae TaxID=178035 RepID=A0A154PEE9_DUFNO|nr:Zinc finger protein 91 [Dufourea novaeangliae]